MLELRGNIFHVDVQPIPARFPGPAAARADAARGRRICQFPRIFELAIQGLDKSWIIIEPEGTQGYAGAAATLLVLLTGAVALVAFLSTVTARNTLRPLERLAESARQFGRTRKAIPIDPAGLHEFEVIARAMNEMQESIKGFIDERTNMLAALSHDLRTSLTGLLFDAEEVTGGESKNRLIAAMEDMERVISATLAFAGDDLKAEPAQKIDLAALLISLCDSFSDRNAAGQPIPDPITFSPSASPWRSNGPSPISSTMRSSMADARACGWGFQRTARRFRSPTMDPAFPRTKPKWRSGLSGASIMRATGKAAASVWVSPSRATSSCRMEAEIRLGAPSQGGGFEVLISLPLPPPPV